MSDKKKTCFVITPIGDDNSDIRRHIDGIIDQVIEPAIGDKYKIIVSHREYEIGSINDRIIRSIYESDLVIANLTNTNPNAMFELAIRYSFGKPAIVIAEKGTNLPFDVIDQNTIFYVNDFVGAEDLKKEIGKYEKKIDFIKENFGPVYKAISKIPLYNEVETRKIVSNEKALKYIIDRLDTIEENMYYSNAVKDDFFTLREYEMYFNLNDDNDIDNLTDQLEEVLETHKLYKRIKVEKEKNFIVIIVEIRGSVDKADSAMKDVKRWEKKYRMLKM